MLERLLAQAAREFEGTLEHVSGFPDEALKVVGLAKGAGGCWHLATKGGRQLGPFDYVIGAFAQHVLTDPFLKTGGSPCEAIAPTLPTTLSLLPLVSQWGDPVHECFLFSCFAT